MVSLLHYCCTVGVILDLPYESKKGNNRCLHNSVPFQKTIVSEDKCGGNFPYTILNSIDPFQASLECLKASHRGVSSYSVSRKSPILLTHLLGLLLNFCCIKIIVMYNTAK